MADELLRIERLGNQLVNILNELGILARSYRFIFLDKYKHVLNELEKPDLTYSIEVINKGRNGKDTVVAYVNFSFNLREYSCCIGDLGSKVSNKVGTFLLYLSVIFCSILKYNNVTLSNNTDDIERATRGIYKLFELNPIDEEEREEMNEAETLYNKIITVDGEMKKDLYGNKTINEIYEFIYEPMFRDLMNKQTGILPWGNRRNLLERINEFRIRILDL